MGTEYLLELLNHPFQCRCHVIMRLFETVSSEFLRGCIREGFILDTNIFLQAFTEIESDEEERKITRSIVSYCGNRGGKIILTPHILAEITNLTINRPRKGLMPDDIRRMVLVLKDVLEHYTKKDEILSRPEFDRFGFADLSVVDACKSLSCGALTSDGALYGELINAHCLAINIKTLAEQSPILDLHA